MNEVFFFNLKKNLYSNIREKNYLNVHMYEIFSTFFFLSISKFDKQWFFTHFIFVDIVLQVDVYITSRVDGKKGKKKWKKKNESSALRLGFDKVQSKNIGAISSFGKCIYNIAWCS